MMRAFRKALCYILVASTILTPELVVAQEAGTRAKARQVALQMIPDDSTVALICFPGSAMRAPATQMLPVEVASAAGLKYLGIDPADVEILVAAARIPERAMPTGAIVIRTKKAIDTDAIPMELTGRRRVDELNGKPYWKTDQGMNWLFLNDKTVIIGLSSSIKAMASRKGTLKTPLKKTLAAGDPQSMNLVVALDPIRPMLDQQIQRAPRLPGELEDLKSIPEDTEAIELRINANEMLSGEISIHTTDESAARRVETTIADAMKFGKRMMLREMADQFASEDPVEQAGAKYAQRMADEWVGVLQPKRDGTKLTLGGVAGKESQVVVIGMLVALLLPAVQAAREAARRAASMNNSKQIILALLNHESAVGKFPAHATYSDEEPLLSWRVAILPYLEQQALYEKFNLDEPWDSPHNRKLIPLMPDVFKHPSSDAKAGFTHYLGVQGEDCFFTGDAHTRRMREFADGTARSLAFVAADEAKVWTKPDDFGYNPRNPLRGLGSLQAGAPVFEATFCDGHVEQISKNVDPDVVRSAMTVNAGD